ncbi:STAS domain-containing protein [Streptomyces monticola]|uniref:Anti-sigma factor antagonist n=1 Tax=Streptomyces monticola TaxID=2666263 RepID=A0ABW2JV99_9ACTN
METSEPTFGLHHRNVDGTLVLSLYGEIDAWAHQVLVPRLTVLLLERPYRQVVVDLRPVTFIDASGLRLLVRVRRHATALDTELRLVRGRPRVWQILRLTGLDRCFTVWDVLPAALEAPGHVPHPRMDRPFGMEERAG